MYAILFISLQKFISMIKLYNKLCENDKTKEEILKNIQIKKTECGDIFKVIPIMHKCFGIKSEEETIKELLYSDADLENSVKLVDKETEEIYGLLLFSHYPITVGSPIMSTDYDLGVFLKNYKQLNGYAFIIDERLRGTSLDKRMLLFNKEFTDQYDFIWCAVEKSLKSHNYWKRLGFYEVSACNEAIFYIMPKDKNMLFDIFIIKALLEKNEKNYNK